MSIKQSVVFRKTGGLDVGIGCQEVVWCLYLENSDVIDGVDAVILRVVYDADNLQDEGHGLGLYPETTKRTSKRIPKSDSSIPLNQTFKLFQGIFLPELLKM